MTYVTQRPSCFTQKPLPVGADELRKCYLNDLERSRCCRGPPPNYSQGSGFLRVAQWNINALRGPDSFKDQCPKQMAEVLLELDADVLIINECGLRRSDVVGGTISAEASSHAGRLALTIQEAGYLLVVQEAVRDIRFGTLMAIRIPIAGDPVFVELDCGRAGTCVKVFLCTGKPVVVYGTHLHHFDGGERRIRLSQATALLRHHADHSCGDAVLFVGDWNQQRCRDYEPHEWTIIADGMATRGEPEDDGVCAFFESQGLACSLDIKEADCNWQPRGLPPPTHWTGTAIDYSFAKGLSLHGCYVVQTSLSDHLPVVCDWKFTGAAVQELTSRDILAAFGPWSTEADVKKVFEAWDSDGDGRIDCEDLFLIVKALIPDVTKKQFQLLFNEIDVNADKFIDYTEFVHHVFRD